MENKCPLLRQPESRASLEKMLRDQARYVGDGRRVMTIEEMCELANTAQTIPSGDKRDRYLSENYIPMGIYDYWIQHEREIRAILASESTPASNGTAAERECLAINTAYSDRITNLLWKTPRRAWRYLPSITRQHRALIEQQNNDASALGLEHDVIRRLRHALVINNTREISFVRSMISAAVYPTILGLIQSHRDTLKEFLERIEIQHGIAPGLMIQWTRASQEDPNAFTRVHKEACQILRASKNPAPSQAQYHERGMERG